MCLPECHPLAVTDLPGRQGSIRRVLSMKIVPPPQNAAVVTLQTVLDRLSANARLRRQPETRPALSGHELR